MTWIGACLVAVFLIGALLGSIFSRQREDAERDQSHANELDYPSDTNQETSIAALARSHVAFAKDYYSTHERNAAYSKKIYKVNLWTALGIGAYTVFTAAIVMFSVIQYGEIHRFNKKQLRFFNDQVAIMRGQLDEMRASSAQTARASRPYLLFEPIAMTFQPTPEQFGFLSVPTGRQFLALFKFTNYGATPAIVYREAHAVDFPTLTQFSFRNMEETPYSHGYVIGSQKSTKDFKTWQGFGSDTWGKLSGVAGNLYFVAVIIYEDVFGENYETRVCFHVDVPFGTLAPREAGANCTNKRT
jgi:hypothetical protein